MVPGEILSFFDEIRQGEITKKEGLKMGEKRRKKRKMGSHVCYLAKVNNDSIKLRKTDCSESFMMETNGKPVIYY